ncbi:MAG TPA: hypothetical protein VFS05_07790 [Gemmatimonadaceae bacterium]|nr:hypothetical protein [Gemmatimonadaceae bacterium]
MPAGRSTATFAILSAAALASAALPRVAPGQQPGQRCRTVASRTSLAQLSGARIASVDIETRAPDPIRIIGPIVDRLHVTTRESTVRRQLLFAPGDTVDTLRVAESMRRLRGQRYLGDVRVVARRCGDDSPVALTVTTRDLWSTKASVRVQGNSQSVIGLTERNLLGTGREASAYVRTERQRVGVGAALIDPWFLGTPLRAVLGTNSYRDGADWFATLGSRQRSVFDTWQGELSLSQSTRDAIASRGDIFERQMASLLFTRRVLVSPTSVTGVIFGAEAERASLDAAPDAPIVGPSIVRRSYVALDLGVTHRSARYDTLTWLLPSKAIVDVPLGFEGEAVMGVGRNLLTGQPAMRMDAWAGRMWLPGSHTMLSADVWGSGFQTEGGWTAGTARAAVAAVLDAGNGLWTAKIAGEHLFSPDPDVRALASEDPTLRALPSRGRLAETAVGASLERSFHLMGLTHSWGVDWAAFGAASLREDPVSPNPEQLYAGVVGLGLRLAPTKVGRGSARLDFGYPVVRSPDVPRRPFIAISVSPWLQSNRHRDGGHEQ